MKRLGYCWLLVICAFVLIACGNNGDKLNTYTKDAQVEERKTEDSTDEEREVEDTTNDSVDEKNTSNKHQEVAKDSEVAGKDSKVQESATPPTNNQTNNNTTPPPVVNEQPKESERIAKVTISIDTKTLVNNMDKVAENKRAYVPSDGWILAPITVEIQKGDSVFDVLSRVTRERRIHMEYQGANQNLYNSVYIQGIGQLYEFDGGELSGWMYTINGAYVSNGASAVKLEDGMNIEWRYTCDLGRDLGL